MLCDDLDRWDQGWEGGPQGTEYMYITYIADSLHCTAKPNMIQ